ncbi:MAG: translation initiation factor [Bacteroidetes bacterium 4572_128]|nr:MAG: translation initiation factor [Bacteroidetes bacterium 4572_128]
MSKKNKRINIVYSTNKDFDYKYESEDIIKTLPPEKQKLKISIDKKKRRGKIVTLITNFIGEEEDLKELAKFLKSKCGVGGSAKNNEIIIQGNFIEKIKKILIAQKYKVF